MKKIIVFLLLFSSVLLLAQEEKLPQNIEDNFVKKYPTASLDGWRYENDIYYLECSIKSNYYTIAFDEKGVWKETAEVISDFDIPRSLEKYVVDTYPEGNISYCEKVEAANSKTFFRVNLFNEEKFIVVTSNSDGSGIKLVSANTLE